MNKLKRYNAEASISGVSLKEKEDGEVVLYKDVEQLEEELKETDKLGVTFCIEAMQVIINLRKKLINAENVLENLNTIIKGEKNE